MQEVDQVAVQQRESVQKHRVNCIANNDGDSVSTAVATSPLNQLPQTSPPPLSMKNFQFNTISCRIFCDLRKFFQSENHRRR